MDDTDFACEEEKLETFGEEPDSEDKENQGYEHPMIGERKVLGEVNLNTKFKTVSKCNRLDPQTLKKC